MKIRLLVFFFMLIFSFVNAQNIDDGLIGYYPFNGDAKDESKNNFHGKIYGEIESVEDRHGNENSAFLFDGVDDYIVVPKGGSVKGDFSFCFWIKPMKSKSGLILFKGENCPERNTKDFKGTSYQIGHGGRSRKCYKAPEDEKNVGEEMNIQLIGKGGRADGKRISAGTLNGKVNAAEYHFYCWLFDSKTKSLTAYKNGEKISTSDLRHYYEMGYSNNCQTIQPSDFPEIHQTRAPLQIGAKKSYCKNQDEIVGFFSGIIDDIRIYNRLLDNCELNALLNDLGTNPKEFISNKIQQNISKWSQKDEYESTAEFEQRITSEKESKTKEFTRQAIEEVANSINWQCGTKKYDADKEAFTLTFNNVEPFQLKVPRSEARQFGDNFDQLEYLNPSFSIGDAPNLIVDCIEIKNPTNGKTYKYGCESGMAELPKGAIKVKSKTVTVKMWDDQKEDGDIVSVFLNDARIKKEIAVKKNEHIFTIELKEGVNIFKLLAHNEGDNPPNTAAILIDDGTDEYQRVLSSKKGEFAELKIVLE